MSVRIVLFSAAFAVVLAFQAVCSWADKPVFSEKFENWSTYTYMGAKGKVCFASIQPVEQNPKDVKRDPPYFLITHRPGENIRSEISTLVGYPFKKDSFLSLKVGKSSFDLFTKGEWAWSKGKDAEVIKALLGASTMELKGVSWRGTQTRDLYRLSGLKGALKHIDTLCPLLK